MYQWDFGILWSYRWLFLNGLGVTVGFTLVIVVLGLDDRFHETCIMEPMD